MPRGEVALEGGLQTSAVGCPVERVAAVAHTLEAAWGVDTDMVAGPREGALVNVCVATGREFGEACQVGGGARLPLGPAQCTAHRLPVAAWLPFVSTACASRSHLVSSLEVGKVGLS